MTETDRTGSPRRRWWPWLLAVCLLAVGGYVYWDRTKAAPGLPAKAAPRVEQPTAVTVAKVRKGDIGLYLTGLGTVIPLNVVTVKSRVDGQLMEVLFTEGQMVETGQLLAVIDPRPFQVQLTQAEGQLLRDQALLDNARADLERFTQLVARGAASRQQLDTQEALVRQLEGTVKVDQGTIENAKLNILYTRITAPFNGRIGLRRVDAGNIVRASDPDGLAVITRMKPISVIFSIPEDNLPRVLARLAAGEPLTVEAFDRAFRKKLAEGKVLTVDNQIDPNTGTIRVKAEFPNGNGELYPNQFVNARLLVETLRDAILVPATALQRGPQGVTVYVVKADSAVEMRPVTVGVIQTGEAAIAKGLAPGETVVVEGAERLRDGAKVAPKGEAGRAQEPAK